MVISSISSKVKCDMCVPKIDTWQVSHRQLVHLPENAVSGLTNTILKFNTNVLNSFGQNIWRGGGGQNSQGT